MNSAGSRDSALTNHGYQQATRLGLHFKSLGLKFTHLFSSHLQRAAKTAGLIREAQTPPEVDVESAGTLPEVEQLRILMEQDFGDLEGKKWTDIQAELQNKPGFVAVETKEAMGQRADTFLDEHLLPLLGKTTGDCSLTIAIVSHGIFLSTLWKRILRRLPAKSISLSPDLQSTARPSLEHLGGWSNTGYLELLMSRDETEVSTALADAATSPTSKPDMSRPAVPRPDDTVGAIEVPASATHAMPRVSMAPTTTSNVPKPGVVIAAARADPTSVASRSSRLLIAHGWTTTILTINGKDHLKGLKRTGGGVGSSRHDTSQKGIESFFKRRKVD